MKISPKLSIFQFQPKEKFFQYKEYAHQGVIAFVAPVQYVELEDFIESIKSCYEEQLNIDNLQATLNANMQIESSYALKLCPLFLKILACKIGYNKIAGGLSTISLSNIGILKAPKSLLDNIESAEFIAAGASTSHSCCVISCGNVTKISITRVIQELDIEKEFFSYLSSLGLDVTVSSNLWEEN